ncbi:MAG: GDSL-type esterase/lipase family protein [Rhodomicrobium sp.]
MSAIEKDFQAWRRAWADSLLDDFAELHRYRAANASLKSPAPDEERIVFFGDSITEGWELEARFSGKPYINRGISSQTTPQMLIRFRQDVIALQPRAAVILAGTNDIGGNTGPMRIEDIAANCASMAEIAKANGVPVIFSSLLPPPHKETPLSRYNLLKHPPEQTLALNRWLKDYCASQGCEFLDYSSAMSGPGGHILPDLSEDGLHPTPAGYRVMAPLAGAAIARILARFPQA